MDLDAVAQLVEERALQKGALHRQEGCFDTGSYQGIDTSGAAGEPMLRRRRPGVRTPPWALRCHVRPAIQPKATSSVIITANPHIVPKVAASVFFPSWDSGMSSSTTT